MVVDPYITKSSLGSLAGGLAMGARTSNTTSVSTWSTFMSPIVLSI